MIRLYKLHALAVTFMLCGVTHAEQIEPGRAQFFLNGQLSEALTEDFYDEFGDEILVSVDGVISKIHFPDWKHLLVKEIYDQRDYDGDGNNDAIVVGESGASCCGVSLYLVSHRGNHFFSVHSFGTDTSAVDISVKRSDDKIYIDVLQDDSSIIGSSIRQKITTYVFENGQLFPINDVTNSGYFVYQTQIDLRSHASMVSDIDFDDDAAEDTLECLPSSSAGFVNCRIVLSSFGEFHYPRSCKNAMVLHSKSHSVYDLGCNRQIIGRFDGKAFNWSGLVSAFE